MLPVRLERMEAALSAGPWLADADYSVADIAAFPTARLLPGLVPDLVNPEATPGILAWLGQMTARPAVQAALSRARQAEAAFAPGPEGSRWG